MRICAVMMFTSLFFNFSTGLDLRTTSVVPAFLTSGLVETKWSGTVSWHKKWSGITGSSDLWVDVSFSEAVPTMYRKVSTTDLNFTDDKGTGTVKYHAVGNLAGMQSETNCASSGLAELHAVTIREWDNTYDIEVRGPACKGGLTVSTPGGSEPYNEDGELGESITITHPLGPNHNLLTGSTTVNSELAGLGKGMKTISWTLTTGPINSELIVTPKDYDKWLPEPGAEETIKGSVMEVDLKVQGVAGKPPKRVESFDVQLVNTSREPGMTLNYPIYRSPKQLPDLRLILTPVAESVDEGQTLNVSSADGKTGKVYIASYDGGGYATLNVDALLDDKTRIKGHLLVSNGDTDIEIPKRTPGSAIGYAWASANGYPNDRDDDETSPDNKNNGDGLSAYEEYRGVICQGKFKRLDPKVKELAVTVSDGDRAFFEEGINWFEAASGLTVLRFSDREIRQTSRYLNLNNATAHVFDQFAIPLMRGKLPPGGMAKTFTPTDDPEIPRDTAKIVIDETNTTAIFQSIQQNAGVPVPYTLAELFAATIAHELAHGVDVPHHGDLKDQPSNMVTSNDRDIHIFDWKGAEITQRPYPITGRIGLPGSGGSGNMSCLMAYNPYFEWALTTGPGRATNYLRVPLMALGRRLCNSKTGTGINASNHYFGDATNGNCLSRIRLKD